MKAADFAVLTFTAVFFYSMAAGNSGLAAQKLGQAPATDQSYDSLPKAGFRFRASRLKVDVKNRADVVRFYQQQYKKSNVANGWSGNAKLCKGQNTAAFREATRQRVNYFRAMGGVPADVTFKDKFNKEAQAAALMMSANYNLSHNPPANWKCYTAAGKKGASRSNLALGGAGPNSIDMYMQDGGSNNKRVGHRTWILNPGLAVAGSGSTRNANALYVIGEFRKNKPKTDFIAWPPAGFVPYQFGHSGRYRWSFQKEGVDLKRASVSVRATNGGSSKPLKTSIEHRSRGLVVWLVHMRGGKVDQDTRYEVSVTAGGKTFSYPVIFIDPEREGAGKIEEGNANNESSTGNETGEVTEPNRPEVSPARLALLNRNLIRAVYKGRTDAARKALKEGASPNAERKKWTALLLAAYYGRTEIARMLLKRGADTKRRVQGFDAARLAYARGHKAIGKAVEAKSGRRPLERSVGPLPAPPR